MVAPAVCEALSVDEDAVAGDSVLAGEATSKVCVGGIGICTDSTSAATTVFILESPSPCVCVGERQTRSSTSKDNRAIASESIDTKKPLAF